MCKLLNVRGRFNIATASVTAICHQNATSKFLGIDLVREFGGERGIRTLEGLLTLTPLAGVSTRPSQSNRSLTFGCFIGVLSILVNGCLPDSFHVVSC